MTQQGWFEGVSPDDSDSTIDRIRDGDSDAPDHWPKRAVEAGFSADEETYYEQLRSVTIEATRQAVKTREQADDSQLVHAVRAMDDCDRTANELAERTAEWAGTLFDDVDPRLETVRSLAEKTPQTPAEEQVLSLASQVDSLATEAESLRSFIEQRAPATAPNLDAMAGPVLAARLIALAGGLEQLAKKPSGTVQVLGAEDALFAHLAGRASSPKHGIIFTHEYVRGTPRENRGSAARALAGKLSIAARIDHYSGELKPEIHEELDERIETIRARTAGGDK
ncbi:NOP58 family protein [Halorubraceae archaeon YAN]|nr:NOP58 family protein [Halorubraceae archaeon YAN]